MAYLHTCHLCFSAESRQWPQQGWAVPQRTWSQSSNRGLKSCSPDLQHLKTSERELKNQLYTPALLGGPNHSSTLKQLDLWLKKKKCDELRFDVTLTLYSDVRQEEDKSKCAFAFLMWIHKKEMNNFTRSAQSVTHSVSLIMICWCCYH